nr:hypothetical protein [uncultured Undibacterium sp.]
MTCPWLTYQTSKRLPPPLNQARKAQSFRKPSIAAGVLRRMVFDHGEQLFPLVF